MRNQRLRQPESVAVGDEPGVDLRRLDPTAPLSHPQRRMLGAAEPRPDVVHVVEHRLHRPAHHRSDVAAARWLAAFGLAIADVEHAVPAELRRRRVAPEVNDVQLRRLRPTQPPPIQHLEQRRVPVRRERTLALGPDRPLHLLIGVVEEPLQLVPGERACLRIALVVVEMRDRVPLVADRHRVGAEQLLALHRPAVAAISEILAEQP
jgi:hypothetical protein